MWQLSNPWPISFSKQLDLRLFNTAEISLDFGLKYSQIAYKYEMFPIHFASVLKNFPLIWIVSFFSVSFTISVA